MRTQKKTKEMNKKLLPGEKKKTGLEKKAGFYGGKRKKVSLFSVGQSNIKLSEVIKWE